MRSGRRDKRRNVLPGAQARIEMDRNNAGNPRPRYPAGLYIDRARLSDDFWRLGARLEGASGWTNFKHDYKFFSASLVIYPAAKEGQAKYPFCIGFAHFRLIPRHS